MKISLRATNNGLILDLHGQWPKSDGELSRVREDMDQALEGRAGPLIYYVHDAKFPKANHLGLLVGAAMRAKGVSHGFAIVSPSERFRERLREVLIISDSPYSPIRGVYGTEEEALRDIERYREWKEGLGNAV